MTTQQIPTRSFCVNHLGGFTLLGNTESLGWTIANNSNVQVVEEPSLDRAYVRGCDQYVRDEWEKNPYHQPILPQFADVLRAPYYALWLNERFILPMLAISAYVTDPIEYIMSLPLNTAVSVRYRQWWQQHLPSVNNLPFVQPQFLLPPKED